MLRSKAAKVTLLLSGLLVLAGCSGPVDSDTASNSTIGTSVSLPDGRAVICVIFNHNSYVGGLDCDWENAK